MATKKAGKKIRKQLDTQKMNYTAKKESVIKTLSYILLKKTFLLRIWMQSLGKQISLLCFHR